MLAGYSATLKDLLKQTTDHQREDLDLKRQRNDIEMEKLKRHKREMELKEAEAERKKEYDDFVLNKEKTKFYIELHSLGWSDEKIARFHPELKFLISEE